MKTISNINKNAICKVDPFFIGSPVNICIRDTVGLKKMKQKDLFLDQWTWNATIVQCTL